MTMFAKHLAESQENKDVTGTPGAVGTEGLSDVTAEATFAEQREAAGALTSEEAAPTDEMSGTTDTDRDLVTGEHGDDPEPTNHGNDVHNDADDTEAVFTDQLEMDMIENLAVDQELDQITAEMDDASDMEQAMAMQIEASIAIESYGLNPGMVSLLKTTRLLESTAIESMGFEAFGVVDGKDPASLMALEALGDSIKEKAAQWGAKIMNLLKSTGAKAMDAISALWSKIADLSSKVTSYAWDKTKLAGATMKAHPVATLVAVAASATAIAGAVALCGRGLPAAGGSAKVFESFLGQVRDQINKAGERWPFSKFKAETNGLKLLTKVDQSKTDHLVQGTVVLGKGGWTVSAVKAIDARLKAALDALKNGWSTLGTRATKLSSAVGDFARPAGATTLEVTKAGVAGYITGMAYIGAITGVIKALYNLTRLVVVGGLRIVMATYRKLSGSTKPAVAAAA